MTNTPASLVNEFMGCANIFMFAANEVFEERLLKQAAGGELTASQVRLLRLVSLTDAQTIGDVAAFLGISNAAASKAVDKLVRRGLLLRKEGEADRRSIHLSLTDLGRGLLNSYETARQSKLEEVFGKVETADLQKGAELLKRLSALIVGRTSKPEEICLQCGMYFPERCLLQELEGRNCHYSQRRSRRDADNARTVTESAPR